jgi:uncharacterized protein YjbI with pentapeptide repeats
VRAVDTRASPDATTSNSTGTAVTGAAAEPATATARAVPMIANNAATLATTEYQNRRSLRNGSSTRAVHLTTRLVSDGATTGVVGRTDEDGGMDAEPLELDHAAWTGERIVGVELDHAQVTDARLDECDLSGVVLTSYAARRVTVTETRIRDCVWSGGIVQDSEFTGCRSERWSLRFSTLQRVTLTGCTLVGADFYGATFDKVVFDGCDLSGAHFDSATVKDLTFRSCMLLGVTGALSLRGAVVDLDDLAALAPSLAREAGIHFSVE